MGLPMHVTLSTVQRPLFYNPLRFQYSNQHLSDLCLNWIAVEELIGLLSSGCYSQSLNTSECDPIIQSRYNIIVVIVNQNILPSTHYNNPTNPLFQSVKQLFACCTHK